VGLVDEGSDPHFFHPRYGERTRPVRGGTIDGDDIENRAAYCLNLEASGEVTKRKADNEDEEVGGLKEENTGKAEKDTPRTEIMVV
jgi:hypothetical protein